MADNLECLCFMTMCFLIYLSVSNGRKPYSISYAKTTDGSLCRRSLQLIAAFKSFSSSPVPQSVDFLQLFCWLNAQQCLLLQEKMKYLNQVNCCSNYFIQFIQCFFFISNMTFWSGVYYFKCFKMSVLRGIRIKLRIKTNIKVYLWYQTNPNKVYLHFYTLSCFYWVLQAILNFSAVALAIFE